MKMTLEKTNPLLTEYEPGLYLIDASDLGVSDWPKTIQTTIGSGAPFARHSKKVDSEGDILWVTYIQGNNETYLRVYND